MLVRLFILTNRNLSPFPANPRRIFLISDILTKDRPGHIDNKISHESTGPYRPDQHARSPITTQPHSHLMRLLLLTALLQAAAALQLPARAPTANRAPTVQMGAEPFDPRIEELIGEHKVGAASSPRSLGPHTLARGAARAGLGRRRTGSSPSTYSYVYR